MSTTERITVQVQKPDAQELSKKIISSPSTSFGELEIDHEKIVAAEPSSIERFDEPAILQSWLEAEDLAYKLYADKEDIERDFYPTIKVRTFPEDGETFNDITYKIEKVATKNGLYAFILSPSDAPKGVIPEVKVIFTGTIDGHGVLRDLEDRAAGHDSFKKEKELLMEAVDAAVGKIVNEKVKISVIGHSLGGADAQRMALKITQAISEPYREEDGIGVSKTKYRHLKDKSVTLHLATNSAARVTEKQCEKFADALHLATTHKNNGHDPLKFEATAFVMNKDVVPRFGERHLLAAKATESSPSVLSMTKATIISIKSTLFGHSLNFYHNSGHKKFHGIECVKTTPENISEDTEKKALKVLGDSKGIDCSAFGRLMKRAILALSIKLGFGEALTKESKDERNIPRCA